MVYSQLSQDHEQTCHKSEGNESMAKFLNRFFAALFVAVIYALPANGASLTVEITYLPEISINADHSDRMETVPPPPMTGLTAYNLSLGKYGYYYKVSDAQGRASISSLPAGIYSVHTGFSDDFGWDEKTQTYFLGSRNGVTYIDLREGDNKHITIVADSLPLVAVSNGLKSDLERLSRFFCLEDFEKRPRFSVGHAKRFRASMVRAMAQVSNDLHEEAFRTVRIREFVEDFRKIMTAGLPGRETMHALKNIRYKLVKVYNYEQVDADWERLKGLSPYHMTKDGTDNVLVGFAATFAAEEGTCAP